MSRGAKQKNEALPTLTHFLSFCRYNFSLMLYGYGCKQDLVERFIEAELHEGALVVVYARKKRISAKQIILEVARALLPANQCSKYASVL